MRGRKKCEVHTTARQCSYCNNFFVKTPEKMQKHVSCCAGKTGFTFTFDNGKVIDYQDHYKNLGDGLFQSTMISKQQQVVLCFLMQKCVWLVIVLLLLFIQT